ncbi:MAG: thermonuclease family protein [Pseudomonadota bacterium]
MVRFFLIAMLLATPVTASQGTVSGVARVTDGDTLRIGTLRIRLHGVDAPEAGDRCVGTSGRTWACGTAATDGLRRLAEGRSVTCDYRDTDRYGRMVARCRIGETDIGGTLVASGLARAYRKYSTDYVGAENRARAAGRGLWADGAATRVAEAAPRIDCAIKGNISKSGRIYHLPGTRSYAKTRIDTSKGERWFCSEAEARAAGWRAPRG